MLVEVAVVLAGCYVCTLLWHLYVTGTADPCSSLPLPPGNVGLPFVGEMLHMLTQIFMGTDFFTTRRIRYGHIYKTHILGRPTVRVAGADNIRLILLADAQTAEMSVPTTVKCLLGNYSLINSTAHAHRAQRKVVMKAFTKEALRGYAMALNSIIDEELTDWLGTHTVFDVTQVLTARAAWEVLVGLHNFKQIQTEIVADFTHFLNGLWTLPLSIPGSSFYKAQMANARLTAYIREEFQKRQSEHYEMRDYHDALSRMLEVIQDQDDQLSEAQVTDLIRELIFAGASTTASAASSLVMYLAQNQRIITKLRQELADHDLINEEAELTYDRLAGLTYLGDIITETLRLAPPVGGGYRKALKTIEIAGFQIPKDWAIIWSAFETHEVSPVFEDNRSEFRPERWEALRKNPDIAFHCVPFGGGSRACVGKEYARLLLRIFTVKLVQKYNWQLVNPEVRVVRFPVRHAKDHLPVIFKRRHDSVSMDTANNNSNSLSSQCVECDKPHKLNAMARNAHT